MFNKNFGISLNKTIGTAIIISLLSVNASFAQSLTSYKYDSKGRLTEVQVGTGAKSTYSFDKTDNRTSVSIKRQFDNSWEAESLYHGTGFAELDGWAANTTTPQGHMVYGPYTNTVPVGSRISTWRILTNNNSGASWIAHIDVYDATAQQSLASRIITSNEWLATNSYQIFELPFTMDSSRAGHVIELRIWHYANANIRVDKVGYY